MEFNSLVERGAELAHIESIVRAGGIVSIEAGAGVGKTSLIDAASAIASREHRVVLRARGSDLERDFSFGVVRQLFERCCADIASDERQRLFAGPAAPAQSLFNSGSGNTADDHVGFAILHGLYWLTVHLADRARLLLAIDDAHWADDASLRWLAYVASRLDGPDVALAIALRPDELAASSGRLVQAVRDAGTILRPALLSAEGVATLVRTALGAEVPDESVRLAHRLTGGNAFYVRELLRAAAQSGGLGARALEDFGSTFDIERVVRYVRARLDRVEQAALRLAQAVAILGDGCELRHAAAVAQVSIDAATPLAAELSAHEVLARDRPTRFIHPIVRYAVHQTLSGAEEDALHRVAARVLDAQGVPASQVAAHLKPLGAIGDSWVVDRLRAAARTAIDQGTPAAAADLLDRALAEPPSSAERIAVLREAAHAHVLAGRADACRRLEEALSVASDRRVRTQISLELAHAHAALFQWTDAVRVLEDALSAATAEETLGLQAQLVAIALQDARTARSGLREIRRLSRRKLTGMPAAALMLAQGMMAVLSGRPASDGGRLLEAVLSDLAMIPSWDARAAALWSLITIERFSAVDAALGALRAEADRSGSSRALVAVYSSFALLKLKQGDLAQADAAARVAFRVVRDGDFAQGAVFAVTVLAETATTSGGLDEADRLLDLLPHEGLPASVGGMLIPAARGRLRLAQGRTDAALKEFEQCIALWDPALWGMPTKDVGYTHARSGAAHAMLALGEVRKARELADAEVADARSFGGPRALGVSLRAAGLARTGAAGIAMLEESAAVLADSPALLERAMSLLEWGAALRRAGRRSQAVPILLQALDLAARCGARPVTERARDELRVAGARPRRDWSAGVESLTPSELRVVRLASDGRTNRQIAQDLYVSIKTVEGHLGRAYGKLGIKGRAELDRVLPLENQG